MYKIYYIYIYIIILFMLSICAQADINKGHKQTNKTRQLNHYIQTYTHTCAKQEKDSAILASSMAITANVGGSF